MNPVLVALTRRLLGLPAPLLFISSEIAENCDGRMTTGFGDGSHHGNGQGGYLPSVIYRPVIFENGDGDLHGDSLGGSSSHAHEL